MENCIKIALECGFSAACELDCSKIEVKEEVRAMCSVNTCRSYDCSWSCPPACGTIEECGKRISKYKKGIIVQTTTQLEDSMDYEGIAELGKMHNENLMKTMNKLVEIYPNLLTLGTGPCKRCSKCTYPDEPCRFPESIVSSMEAYGMVVNDVCKANDIPYYYGKDTLTYVACFLIE